MPDTNYHLMPSIQSVGLRRLGPAKVTAILRSQVEIEAEGRTTSATLAVAGLYCPVKGDTVLVIETDEAAFVIGVLRSAGPMTIRAPGDLRLQAPNGAIVLEAARVDARAHEINLDAKDLHIGADRLRERFRTVRRVVAEALELDAGSVRTRVRETCAIFARRFHATAEDDVKIDGKRIHLG